MRVTKSILHLCWWMNITVFLYLNDALVPANSYTQAKEDEWKVVQFLQRLGFMLNLEKCKLQPTQEFTYLGLVLNTQSITLSLPKDKVVTIKTQAAKVASSSTCRGVIRLLGLTNVASMSLPLSKLHSCPLQYCLKENYKTPDSLFKGAEARLRGYQGPILVVHLQATTRVIWRPLIEEVVTKDASKEGYGPHE